jgi:hypothetical protein
MMILASAMLAGSLLATGAQARGGGGGGGHMGGLGGGHIGGFGGGRIGGLGVGHVDGYTGHVGGFHAGQMAHVGHENFGMGRRHFVGGVYDYGLDCRYNPDYTSSTWPYTCTY